MSAQLGHFAPGDAHAANEQVQQGVGQPASLDDFYAHLPDHRYIYTATGDLWPAASVDRRLPRVKVGVSPKGEDAYLAASHWLDQHRAVEQMVWAPGEPMLIRDRLITEGAWIDRPGSAAFNLYRPGLLAAGDPTKAQPWLDHVRRLYPDEADHIVRWLAHRVQKPGEKINHALVLGGAQGIGKDTILEPVKYAVGPWNFCEVSPKHLFGNFNGFVKSVVLRISEARDLGDVDRFAFYDHTKTYIAAPPDVHRCNEKNRREYPVSNVMGVIITTNHRTDGIYLPADDRRHFVAWSARTKDEFGDDYFRNIYGWYDIEGSKCGIRDVAAYLAELDLSDFDSKVSPPKTAAFFDIVDANRAPEDADLADAIEQLKNPVAVTLEQLAAIANDELAKWLLDRRNRRLMPRRLEAAGYMPCRNPNAKDGLWAVQGKRSMIYTQRHLAPRDALAAAANLGQSR